MVRMLVELLKGKKFISFLGKDTGQALDLLLHKYCVGC